MNATARRSGSLPRLLAGALVVGLALTGCASGPTPSATPEAPLASSLVPLAELDLLEHPRDYEGPSTAILAVEDDKAAPATPTQSLPTTVTSHDLDGDIQVQVDSAKRIIGLDIAGSIGA